MYDKILDFFTSCYYWVICLFQKIRYGYSTVEAYNTDMYVAKYALPRVRHLFLHGVEHPSSMTMEEWKTTLSNILFALEHIADESWVKYYNLDDPDDVHEYNNLEAEIQKGCVLFGKYFQNLMEC